MSRLTIGEIQGVIIYVAVLLTPFLGLSEVSWLLGFDVISTRVEPWVIKIAKDLFISMSILVGVLFGITSRHAMPVVSVATMFLIVVFSVACSLLFMSNEALFAGFRWLLPLIFYFTLQGLDKLFFIRISRILNIMLIAGLTLQIYQYFMTSGIYGLNEYGYSIRNPGYFLIPSSMAAYAMASLYFVIRFEPLRLLRFLAFTAAVFSVILTSSGTGFISFAMFVFFVMRKEEGFKLYIILAIFIGLTTLPLLPILTNREYVLSSLETRVKIFMQHTDILKLLFSNTFGAGTNSLINLRPDLLESGEATIADSMLSSSVINLGILFLLISIYEFFIRPMRKFGRAELLYFSSFFPFYLTVVLFELFPVNILMFIALSELTLEKNSTTKNTHCFAST